MKRKITEEVTELGYRKASHLWSADKELRKAGWSRVEGNPAVQNWHGGRLGYRKDDRVEWVELGYPEEELLFGWSSDWIKSVFEYGWEFEDMRVAAAKSMEKRKPLRHDERSHDREILKKAREERTSAEERRAQAEERKEREERKQLDLKREIRAIRIVLNRYKYLHFDDDRKIPSLLRNNEKIIVSGPEGGVQIYGEDNEFTERVRDGIKRMVDKDYEYVDPIGMKENYLYRMYGKFYGTKDMNEEMKRYEGIFSIFTEIPKTAINKAKHVDKETLLYALWVHGFREKLYAEEEVYVKIAEKMEPDSKIEVDKELLKKIKWEMRESSVKTVPVLKKVWEKQDWGMSFDDFCTVALRAGRPDYGIIDFREIREKGAWTREELEEYIEEKVLDTEVGSVFEVLRKNYGWVWDGKVLRDDGLEG